MLSDSESELFITQSSFSGSRSIDLSENNFESLFADADNEKAVIGSFRLDYEYEIEYDYDFSILFCRLHIIITSTQFIP